MNWYLEVLKKYVVFSGRARRKEYWMFALFNFIISFSIGSVVGFFGAATGTNLRFLYHLYLLAVLLPSIAVTVRRLHDTDRSGWWLLLCFIPIIGWIALLIFYVQDSTPGENKYGANPKEIVA